MILETPDAMPHHQTARLRQDTQESGHVLTLCRHWITAFWNGPYYFSSQVALASLFLLLGQPTLGICFFLCGFSVFLLFCKDILSSLLPFLLLFIMGSAHYDNVSQLLIHCAWLIPLAVAALTARLLGSQCFWSSGKMTGSLTAVSCATILGGLGVIRKEEFLSLLSVYYCLGLGLCMLLIYSMLRAQLAQNRAYDLGDRFAAILYSAGIFTAVVVIGVYMRDISSFLQSFSSVYFSYRNFCATILLMALPMPCYFMRRSGRHLLGLVFLYITLLMTGSRSGLVFGTALLAVSLLKAYRLNPRFQKRRHVILLCLIPVGATLFFFAQDMFASRLTDGKLISIEDSRVTFFRRAILDFLQNPLFGQGLGSMKNRDVFIGVNGSIVWYHNAVAQVFGSMGLTGAFAYGWLMRDRILILRDARKSKLVFFCLSYLGIFSISMTNPGEFCPLPNEFLVIVLFAILEQLETSSDSKPSA